MLDTKVKYWIVNVCRILVALIFVFSGFVKGVDPMGGGYKIADYLSAFGVIDIFPKAFPIIVSFALATLEFTLGVLLFWGVMRGITTVLSALFMVVMTPLTLYIALTNPVYHCGCFGDALILSNWQTFLKNLVLLPMVIACYSWRKQIRHFMSRHVEWVVARYVAIFALLLWGYCYLHLPVLDFRPYRVGTPMKYAMGLTETSADKLPTILDFYVQDYTTGDDITEALLEYDGYSFILVAPDLNSASEDRFDLLNELYDYSVAHNYPFICLTASDNNAIANWQDRTGADYSFGIADNLALKTMVRSNPGVILLRGDTIFNKWAFRDMPDEYQLQGKPLEENGIGRQEVISSSGVLWKIIAWFIGPLLLVLLLDRIILSKKQRQSKRDKEKKELEEAPTSPEDDTI